MRTRLAVAAAAAIALMTVPDVDRMLVTPLLAQNAPATILAQVRAALGGEERLAAVKALGAEGSVRRAAGPRTVDSEVALLIVRPDKLRRSEESSLLGTTVERISTFDGIQAWDETVSAARVGGGGGFDHSALPPGGLSGQAATDHAEAMAVYRAQTQGDSAGQDGALTEEQRNASRLRRMKMDLQRWTIALLADSSRPFTNAVRAESPDGPADVLETSDEAGRPVRFFVDTASHMPLLVQYQEVRPQPKAAPAAAGTQNDAEAASRRVEELRAQGAPTLSTRAMHLTNYKKVDGVMLPHQIDVSVDGQASESWTLEKFKINPTVKADVFQKKAK